jgi:hypothetical protein
MTAVDLLMQTIECARPALLDKSKPTKERVRILWSAAKRARDLGSDDVVSAEFLRLAIETNLIDSNGRWTGDDVRKSVIRYGREDVEHVICWALRGWSPFEKGPLT